MTNDNILLVESFFWGFTHRKVFSICLFIKNVLAVAAYSRLASGSQAKFQTMKLSPLSAPCAAAPAQSTVSTCRSLRFSPRSCTDVNLTRTVPVAFPRHFRSKKRSLLVAAYLACQSVTGVGVFPCHIWHKTSLYPRPTKLEGGILDSPCPSVCPSVVQAPSRAGFCTGNWSSLSLPVQTCIMLWVCSYCKTSVRAWNIHACWGFLEHLPMFFLSSLVIQSLWICCLRMMGISVK